MLKVNAADYIAAGEAFAKIKPLLDPTTDGWFDRNAPLDSHLLTFVFDNVMDLLKHCDRLQLSVTAGLISKLAGRFAGKQEVSKNDAYVAMNGISEAFKVELETKLFFYVLPHRRSYFGGEGGSPDNPGRDAAALIEAIEPFPEAVYDAKEAGTCFAFERFTASAYHLMRTAEHGLVTVAAAANVQSPDYRSWDRMINGIHGHIKKLSSANPKIPNWKDEEKKFSDLCSWFTAIRNGWRNPVSHVPRVFAEPTVRGMFAATQTLFEHLKATGFSSATMPKKPIALPDDAEDSAPAAD